MKNIVQSGDRLDLVPAIDVPGGTGYQFSLALFGVAIGSVSAGSKGVFRTRGVVDIAKVAALAIDVGDRLYWDPVSKVVNKTSGIQVGVAIEAAANPSATVKMLMRSGSESSVSGDWKTVVGGQLIPMELKPNEVLVQAGGATSAQLDIPSSGSGRFWVQNGDRKSNTAVYLYHKQQGVRMAKAASSITLPNVVLDDGNADTAWFIHLRARVAVPNTTTNPLRFMRVGAGAGFFSVGYEGAAAANPNCLRVTAPNAAGNGVSAVRSNSSPEPAFAPFGAGFAYRWMNVFVIKTNTAGITENYLSPSTGLPTSTVRAGNSITLAYCPDLAPDASGTLLYGGSVNIPKANFSGLAATPIVIGPDLDTTGAFDISDLTIVHQMPTQAQLIEVAKGKLWPDVAGAVTAGVDRSYEFISLSPSEIMDRCGGAAATSVTMASGDGLTPVADLAKTLQFAGNTGSAKVSGWFMDGTGYPDVWA